MGCRIKSLAKKTVYTPPILRKHNVHYLRLKMRCSRDEPLPHLEYTGGLQAEEWFYNPRSPNDLGLANVSVKYEVCSSSPQSLFETARFSQG